MIHMWMMFVFAIRLMYCLILTEYVTPPEAEGPEWRKAADTTASNFFLLEIVKGKP